MFDRPETPPAQLVASGIAAVFAALFLWLNMAAFRSTVYYDEERVRFIGAFGRVRELRWADVREVTYSSTAMQIYFKGAGTSVPAHLHFSGIAGLLVRARAKLGGRTVDEAFERAGYVAPDVTAPDAGVSIHPVSPWARWGHGLAILALAGVYLWLRANSDAQTRAEELLLEARSHWEAGEYAAQGASAQAALDASENNGERAAAYYWLGVAANLEGRRADGAGYLAKALEIDPDYAAAHASIASSYLFLGEYEKAREHAETAVRIDPEYGWGHYALGNYYHTVGQPDLAAESFCRASELSPDNEDFRQFCAESRAAAEQLDD